LDLEDRAPDYAVDDSWEFTDEAQDADVVEPNLRGDSKDSSDWKSDYDAFYKGEEVGCLPDCLNKECGNDGCGGNCGECGDDLGCHNDKCCQPSCIEKLCWQDDGCEGECLDESCLPIEIEVLWNGHYEDTPAFLDSLPDGYAGAQISNSGTTVSVDWRAVVFQDCFVPEGFIMQADADQVSLALMDTVCPVDPAWPNYCDCKDTDIVADVSTEFELPPGDYVLSLSCHFESFYASCGEWESFEIHVP